jgi:hypothetical protein
MPTRRGFCGWFGKQPNKPDKVLRGKPVAQPRSSPGKSDKACWRVYYVASTSTILRRIIFPRLVQRAHHLVSSRLL